MTAPDWMNLIPEEKRIKLEQELFRNRQTQTILEETAKQLRSIGADRLAEDVLDLIW